MTGWSSARAQIEFARSGYCRNEKRRMRYIPIQKPYPVLFTSQCILSTIWRRDAISCVSTALIDNYEEFIALISDIEYNWRNSWLV